MNIAMMSVWNETSGVSVHAELIGKEWVKAGYTLKVFSFLENDFHGHSLIGVDQPYVIRCFGTEMRSNYLNPIPFLKEDYDVFVVQDLGMLPKDKLAKIFPHIKKKAKTIHVVHEGRLPDDPSFFQFDWDAIVCFDHRYKNFLKEVFPEDKIRIIPFPCHWWMEGDKVEARRKLNLPLDKKIIFAFGQKWRNMLDTVPAIRELSQKYPIKVVIVSGAQRVYGFNELDSEIRKAVLEHSGVYDYLHAADAMILGKHSVPGVVLSSTAHLCLGSGCPIIARDSNFFELMDREVLKYKDLEEFKENLISAFTEDERCKATKKAAREYVERNSAEKIAKRLIEVFKEVANHT